ncbi:hypothetical protein [Aminobacterium mobile]
MTISKDNVIVQVPQPLIHFPPFFPAQVATEGFSRTEISEYGDIISISSPRTPRVREMLIFLACLTFLEDGKVEKDGSTRFKLTVSGKEWRRRAGLGRTKRERERWEDSIKTLAALQFDVEICGAVGKDGQIYKKRSNPVPYNRVILSGILNDIKFLRKEDIVTFTIPKEFLKGIDITGLRISLTHLLSLSGNISRLLAYALYGRQSWLGTWDQLAALAGIADWESERRQKQALKKALDELEKNGFKIEVGQEKIKITRRKGLLGGILEM